MSGLTTTTYSMWRLFRNCRMACKWRYIDELVPLTRNPNLYFGSVIHECLELWHGQRQTGSIRSLFRCAICIHRVEEIRHHLIAHLAVHTHTDIRIHDCAQHLGTREPVFLVEPPVAEGQIGFFHIPDQGGHPGLGKRGIVGQRQVLLVDGRSPPCVQRFKAIVR